MKKPIIYIVIVLGVFGVAWLNIFSSPKSNQDDFEAPEVVTEALIEISEPVPQKVESVSSSVELNIETNDTEIERVEETEPTLDKFVTQQDSRPKYQYAEPEDTLELRQKYWGFMRCHVAIELAAKRNGLSVSEIVSQASKEPVDGERAIIRENFYNKCVEDGFPFDEMNSMDDLERKMFALSDELQEMGNERFPAAWSSLFIQSTPPNFNGFKEEEDYTKKVDKALNTLHSLMEKGDAKSANMLLNYYANANNPRGYDEDRVREILSGFFGLDGEEFEDRLQELLTKNRPSLR